MDETDKNNEMLKIIDDVNYSSESQLGVIEILINEQKQLGKNIFS